MFREDLKYILVRDGLCDTIVAQLPHQCVEESPPPYAHAESSRYFEQPAPTRIQSGYYEQPAPTRVQSGYYEHSAPTRAQSGYFQQAAPTRTQSIHVQCSNCRSTLSVIPPPGNNC